MKGGKGGEKQRDSGVRVNWWGKEWREERGEGNATIGAGIVFDFALFLAQQ